MEGSNTEKKGEQEPMREAWVYFGNAGHEGEYVLSLEDFGAHNYIPGDIEMELKKELGTEWAVDNRGSRIEIFHRRPFGARDDEKVHAAIRNVLTQRGYILTI